MKSHAFKKDLRRLLRRGVSFVLCLAAACGVLTGCAGAQSVPEQEPISLTVWTYYNGDQLAAFQELIRHFNDTVGREKKITVESYNLGSVNDLQDAVMNSADGKIGAQPLPDIFMAYADTAFAIDEKGLLADLTPYLTPKEREEYVDGYLEEGALGGGDTVKIFPIAKSVELFLLNRTDFAPFSEETGITEKDLATFEGVARVAKAYYEWTDAKTPEPYDGQAFFGRDSMSNYFLIGAKQLGVTLVRVEDGKPVIDFDKDAVRRIWDNYYVPFVQGYFDASGRYRSDDIKTGNIIALVGSSSGATYFPDTIIRDDADAYEVELEVLPCPQFEGGEKYAVQQGAGMVVIDKSEEVVKAGVEFLKWFTQKEQNIRFSVQSGYLPVKKESNHIDVIREAGITLDARMEAVLSTALESVEQNTLYTPQAFRNGTKFREMLDYGMYDRALADAKTVREAVEAGASLEEASAPFLSDACFEEWYASIYNRLEKLVQEDT